MIKMISGLPRAGKGVYTFLETVEVLKNTSHHIIGNFAFELQPWVRQLSRNKYRAEMGMLAYLRSTYGETFDAEHRIHILPQEEMKRFYLWRVGLDGNLVKLTPRVERKGAREVVVGFDENSWNNTLPCVYINDEAWATMNARNWMENEAGIQFYCAQHGKAPGGGDDFWIVCQHSSQIDKQAKVLVQEYHTCVNHKWRQIGPFKQPNRISVVITNEPPELRSGKLQPLPRLINFDTVGVGGSFNTAKGAGVSGTGAADITRKRKGLPFWLLPLVILLIGAGLIFAARAAGWGAGMLLVGGFNKSAPGQSINKGIDAMSKPFRPVPSGGLAYTPQATNLPQSQIVHTSGVPVYVSGYAWIGNLHVFLSDGRHYYLGDGHCSAGNAKESWFIIDGRRYYMLEKLPYEKINY